MTHQPRRATLSLKNPPAKPPTPPSKAAAFVKPVKHVKKPKTAKPARPAKPAKVRRHPNGSPWTEGEIRQAREMRQAQRRRKEASAAMLKTIQALAPTVFDPAERKPLALRIDIAICAALGVRPNKVAPTLKWWTNHSDYHRALLAGGPRYALDGSIVGVVSETERAYARAKLGETPAAEEAA